MKMKAIVVAVVAVALLAAMTVFAGADVVTYQGTGDPNSTASGIVTARATVNPKIELTITTPDPSQEVLFGAVDPATLHEKLVNLSVRSNKSYDLTKADSGDIALMGFSTSLVNQMDQSKTIGRTYADTYSINVPYDTDPGNYAAAVVYTVTQK